MMWEKIRPLNGSQNNAFEELICQLAKVEYAGKGKFTRIAAPDGGVEAICELDNGEQYGWQAKYFLSSFTDSQWAQIKDSLLSAVKNYPKLVKYFVCVAVDRNNPVVEGKRSFLQKWNEHVQEWQKDILNDSGRTIEIEFWGSFELNELLTKPENAGKHYYWFHKEELSQVWFEQFGTQAIENLGPRYTPEINIELPIANYFEALSRSKHFKKEYTDKFHHILIELQKRKYEIAEIKAVNGLFEQLICCLKKHLNLALYNLEQRIPVKSLSTDIEGLKEELRKYIKYDSDDNKQKEINRELGEIISQLHKLDELIHSDEIKLFNGDILCLFGKAGVGKSHLFGDVTAHKLRQGKAVILLLGQDFTKKSNAWTQILNDQLNLKISQAEFLSALSSIAEIQKERVIFAIDALNEGEGKDLWNNQLNGLIAQIRDYPNIGLALNVRDTYADSVFAELSAKNKNAMCHIHHWGFDGVEFEAIQSFFSFYQLTLPSVPLLNPEFSNPLYLKLLCESLVKQGLSAIPKGNKGFNQIIDSYLQGVNKSISKQLNEDECLNLVARAVRVVAELSLNNDSLEYRAVKKAITQELQEDISESSDAKKFIDYLIKEGVLTKNKFASDKEEIVYFIYERVGDYQKANLILEKINSVEELVQWFSNGQNLKLRGTPYLYRSILEAFAVIVPEKYGCELFEVLNIDNEYDQERFVETVINSLIWRDSNSINSEKFIGFIKEKLSDITYPLWVDMLYQLAVEPEHPFNILYLHNKLYPLSLADRDAFWTTFISTDYDEASAISRLLTWCKQHSFQKNIEPQSLFQAAVAVSWLFSSTHIRQRNEAVTALAHLLVNRLDIAHRLYVQLLNINDPYISDGILHAIHHAILYSTNLNGLKSLAEEIYRHIFDISAGEEVYPNVLVRDSARHIIEYSLKNQQGYSEEEQEEINQKITPPYVSSFPDELPSTEYIDKKYTDSYQKIIIRSMTTEYGRGMCAYGDFGRYTFQSALRKWESSHLGSYDGVISFADLLSNYACELIFEKYGYDSQKHGDFDKENRSSYRGESKIERIGKKYQWLALFEILARVMDHFQAPKERYQKDSPMYWVTDLSDFYLPRPNIKITFPDSEKHWQEYGDQIPVINTDHFWDSADLDEWITDAKNLPTVQDMIDISINGEDWLALERYENFESPSPFGEESYNEKYLWFQIRSYLIPKNEFSQANNWLKEQNFMGRWMPEERGHYNTDLQNFFYSSSYQEYHIADWEIIEHNNYRESNPQKPFRVLPTVENHNWESTHGNDSECIYAPCYFIYHGMQMHKTTQKGYWSDENQQLVCFDPIMGEQYQPMLLIRKDAFLKFLEENNLKVIWTVLGEKLARESTYDVYHKRLDIYGTYSIDRNKKLKGKINTIITD